MTDRAEFIADCAELRELAAWFDRKKDELPPARMQSHGDWLREVADKFELLADWCQCIGVRP